MSLLDRITDVLAMRPVRWDVSEPVETRAAMPFEVNIPGLFGLSSTNYRIASVREALGVPAVQRAVTLISNTAGALSMSGIQNGSVVDAQDRPRLIVRPNPLTTPRVFWRDSAYWKATRGESWWWVAKRDTDGMALSLVPVPPFEIKVEENRNDSARPTIRWRDRVMPNEDMILDTLQPDPERPWRGIGPLQACGAAISVAVEADAWAANFYAQGGYPSVYLKSDYDFPDEDEPNKIKAKWTSVPPNTPHILSPGLDVGTLDMNESGAQMLEARVHNRGEVALMFGIPGHMLETNQSGSSLTYQNVGQAFDSFVKQCLWPNYLEGAEQLMTDLLPRSWVAEFDTDRFTRPDPKTRMEIHKLAIEAGIYDAEFAQVQEGLLPGSIETAPIPPSPPAAIPPAIQLRTAPEPVEVRCDGMVAIRGQLRQCNRKLADAAPFTGTCKRCRKEHGLTAAASAA